MKRVASASQITPDANDVWLRLEKDEDTTCMRRYRRGGRAKGMGQRDFRDYYHKYTWNCQCEGNTRIDVGLGRSHTKVAEDAEDQSQYRIVLFIERSEDDQELKGDNKTLLLTMVNGLIRMISMRTLIGFSMLGRSAGGSKALTDANYQVAVTASQYKECSIGNGMIMKMMLVTVVITIISTVVAMKKCTSTIEKVTQMRTIGVQSQCTYTALRGAETPRFLPLPGDSHGASI